MKITKIPGLGRFGHFIDDVDLSTISDEEWNEIGQLHLKGLVTIIRGNDINHHRYNDLIVSGEEADSIDLFTSIKNMVNL